MRAQEAYPCPDCRDVYDEAGEALACCAYLRTVWICGECDQKHEEQDNAEACCGGEIRCPTCARDYATESLDGLAIQIAKHCRVCNPHFTYDTQHQIEELHFQARGQWVSLNK